MTDITIRDGASIAPESAQERQIALALRTMADSLRAMNERIASLDRQVRLLTKVTPAQAAEINAAVRERAQAICASYCLPDGEKTIASAIRREIRLMQGARSMRDLPMCEYAVTLKQIALWDDYKVVRAVRARGEKGGNAG